MLIGPTGAGKTPLGHWLETHQLWGRRCHHFDFGANLRAAASGTEPDRFSSSELRFLQDVLEKGALLENDSFHLATRILDTFLRRRNVQPEDLIILNGLPRHVGQAEAIDHRLAIIALIHLQCDAHTVRARLARDTGGDRGGRTDDAQELVARKLEIFAERTRPLLDHYRQRGSRLVPVRVCVETQPSDIVAQLGTAAAAADHGGMNRIS